MRLPGVGINLLFYNRLPTPFVGMRFGPMPFRSNGGSALRKARSNETVFTRPVLATLLLGALFLGAHSRAIAQAFPMFNGTVNTCVGAFLDSGGQGAGGYSNNEDITYTICPDVPGGAI